MVYPNYSSQLDPSRSNPYPLCSSQPYPYPWMPPPGIWPWNMLTPNSDQRDMLLRPTEILQIDSILPCRSTGTDSTTVSRY